VTAAPALVPDGQPLWAQVATANTASLRTFLAAGYRAVCAEVLFAPWRSSAGRDHEAREATHR
jgi:hypothetical protein